MNYPILKKAIEELIPDYELLTYNEIANILNEEVSIRTYIMPIPELEKFIDIYGLFPACEYIRDNYQNTDSIIEQAVKAAFKWLLALGDRNYKTIDINYVDVNLHTPIRDSITLIMNTLAELNFIDSNKIAAHTELLEELTDVKIKRVNSYNIYEHISGEMVKEALLSI